MGRLLARAAIGGLFIGHGTQKLFGWFGGHGPDGTGKFFESLGLRPGKRNALAAGGVEAGGGALLAAGFLTPVASAGLIATMFTAIRKVHGKNGPWSTDGGWEYNAVLIAALLAITEAGPGPLSIDAALDGERRGTALALATLAAGAAGSYAVTQLAERQPAAEPEQSAPAEHVTAEQELDPTTAQHGATS
jgi:putative oxidoreductase